MTDGKQPNSPRARAAGAVLGAVLPCLAAAVARAGELTIEVSGITPNRGQVYVALYDRAETFPMAGQQRVNPLARRRPLNGTRCAMKCALKLRRMRWR